MHHLGGVQRTHQPRLGRCRRLWANEDRVAQTSRSAHGVQRARAVGVRDGEPAVRQCIHQGVSHLTPLRKLEGKSQRAALEIVKAYKCNRIELLHRPPSTVVYRHPGHSRSMVRAWRPHPSRWRVLIHQIPHHANILLHQALPRAAQNRQPCGLPQHPALDVPLSARSRSARAARMASAQARSPTPAHPLPLHREPAPCSNTSNPTPATRS